MPDPPRAKCANAGNHDACVVAGMEGSHCGLEPTAGMDQSGPEPQKRWKAITSENWAREGGYRKPQLTPNKAFHAELKKGILRS